MPPKSKPVFIDICSASASWHLVDNSNKPGRTSCWQSVLLSFWNGWLAGVYCLSSFNPLNISTVGHSSTIFDSVSEEISSYGEGFGFSLTS
ncbi:hypothetical protein PILCRDRAFT_819979 [Piloderma croceum F 1598]|uniref:Uncharacterized protein n=1 Tax=Piloderma croceum (strain F 1598) TaxID=765440 RepID=A0A0C3BZ84_PILCF|nr:hypothetical protein PILCRDRAFT_819979 [Piloderma croceum F 1598]